MPSLQITDKVGEIFLKSNKKTKENILYALRNMRLWDPVYGVICLLRAPVSVASDLCIPLLLGTLVSLAERKEAGLNMWLLMGAFFLLSFALDFTSKFLESRSDERRYSFSCRYQNLLIEKFLTTDYENTESPAIALLYTRAMDDACSGNCAPEFIIPALIEFVVDLLGIFTYISVMASISFWIPLILVISSGLLYALQAKETAYLDSKQNERASIEHRFRYFDRVSRDLSYGKELRLLSLGEWMEEILCKLCREKLTWLRNIAHHENMTALWVGIVGFFRDICIYSLLLFSLLQGKCSAAGLVVTLSMMPSISSWMVSLVTDLNTIEEYGIKIGYYREYISYPEQIASAQKSSQIKIASSCPPEISLQSVCYTYPGADKPSLKDITATIYPGEKIAIVGENGAGKTTLIKLLCGLYIPSTGKIEINRIFSGTIPQNEYYSLFAAVFQDIHILPISIANFITSGEKPDEHREKIKNLLKITGLWDKVDSLPHKEDTLLKKGVFWDSVDLSGGENQKLLLARALYKDAPIILLDEPTAALDPLAEEAIYRDFSLLTQGKTAFFISHRLASTRFCDKIWLMQDGRIAEMGTHDELMKMGGAYKKMYEAQAHAYREDQNEEDDNK